MRCQVCGVQAETRYVEFYQNIGVLIMRFSKSIKGDLCKSCVHHYFWELTMMSMLLGWWGIISFFLNIFFIGNNVIRYLGCLGMAPVGQRHARGGGVGQDDCPHCGRHDPELKRRGYCLNCNRDL
jgi:hypothetical protein